MEEPKGEGTWLEEAAGLKYNDDALPITIGGLRNLKPDYFNERSCLSEPLQNSTSPGCRAWAKSHTDGHDL
jgi:hypothetical protein